MSRNVEGRAAITREEIRGITGAAESTIRAFYTDRAKSGHPDVAFTVGRTMYWWQDEIEAWWSARQAEPKPEPIERIGDPDELLFADQVAGLLGRSQGRSIIAAVAKGAFPVADHVEAGAARNGVDRPQWKRSTVWDYADGRKFDGTAASQKT